MSSKHLTIILGAGPGTGASLGSAFAKLGAVALLARRLDSLKSVQQSIVAEGGEAEPFVCDASSQDSIKQALKEIKARWPEHDLKCACYNANAPFVMKPFLELQEADLKPGIDLYYYGALNFSQAVIPWMLSNKSSQGGTIIFSGATASMKGSAKFAAFAPAKFALRAMSQSLAREFQPQGIHVAHTILDGLIDTPAIQERFGKGEEGKRLQPEAIAKSYVYLHQQDRSCWTHELDLRPSAESF